MPGQWVEDPSYPSGWRWDTTAPDPDPSLTSILSRYGGPTMSSDMQDSYQWVCGRADPDTAAESSGPVDGPATWTGSDPAVTALSATTGPPDLDFDNDLVCCPMCGSGVHPDRIRD